MSKPVDLTGEWRGIYNYARLEGSNEFLARLVDFGGAITGETEEQDTLPNSGGQHFPARIEGRREGLKVRFRKYYDDLRMAADVLFYDGNVDADGSEITGRWHIPGDWDGTFIMVRPREDSAEIENTIAEEVR